MSTTSPSGQSFSTIKILAVVHTATKEQRLVLDKLLSVTFPGAVPVVVDAHFEKIPSDKFDLILGFGAKAGKSLGNTPHVGLAAVKMLEDKPENAPTRLATYQALLGLAAKTVKPVEVSSLDFAAFSSDSLEKIKKALVQRGKPWEGKTATGKTISISIELDAQSTADISLTIDEVFAMKFLMDVMGVETITLTPIQTPVK